MLNSHSLLMSRYTVCQTGSFWSFIFGAKPLNCILKFDNAVRDGQLPIWEFVLKRIVPQTFFPLGLFAPAWAVLRDLQTLTLAHIYQNLHSAKFSLTLAKPWWCSEIKTRLQCGRSWGSLAGGREVRGWDGRQEMGTGSPLYYLLSDGHLGLPPQSSTPPELASTIPNFPPSFRYFPHIFFAKKVQRPIWPTIDSMQLAVTLPGSETIVSRWNSSKKFLRRRNWIVRPEPSACKVWTKHRGGGRKSTVTKECTITNFCQGRGKKTKQIAAAEHVQVTAMRGPGWRLVDGDHESKYWDCGGCLTHTDRMTMTLDVDGGKGQIERPGTVRRMFIAGQRSNRDFVRVSVCVSAVSKRVLQSRIRLCGWQPRGHLGLSLGVRSSLIAGSWKMKALYCR